MVWSLKSDSVVYTRYRLRSDASGAGLWHPAPNAAGGDIAGAGALRCGLRDTTAQGVKNPHRGRRGLELRDAGNRAPVRRRPPRDRIGDRLRFERQLLRADLDRKSTRLNSSHLVIS